MFAPRAPETVVSIRRVPTWLRNSRKEAIRQGVPGLMEAFALSMRQDGCSVKDALREVPATIEGCPRALVEEMASVGLLMDAGADMSDALKAVADRVDMPEFDMLVSSCSESDGRARQDVIRSLEVVAARLRERNDTLGLMRTTEQNAVLSGAVVGCVPFGALLITNMMFPGQIQAVSGVISQFMLAIAFAFVLAGVAWICSLGRTMPGQTSDEIREMNRALPRRMIAPLAACIAPALFLVGLAPIVKG